MKKPKEPEYPALLLFADGQTEYVVIATEGPMEDHARAGFECVDTIELGDTSIMPTDVALWKR